jgi:hypothetical protein
MPARRRMSQDDARQQVARKVVEHLELSGFEIDEERQVMTKRRPAHGHGFQRLLPATRKSSHSKHSLGYRPTEPALPGKPGMQPGGGGFVIRSDGTTMTVVPWGEFCRRPWSVWRS